METGTSLVVYHAFQQEVDVMTSPKLSFTLINGITIIFISPDTKAWGNWDNNN